jgi:2'-5' RNA ligase
VTEQERPRSGVVSLLDERHSTLVGQMWDEIQRELGLIGVRRTPWPHFSYQVGDYDTVRIHEVLERIAQTMSPFVVTTAGLAIFTSAQPVLYVPVVRTAELSRRQQALWNAIGDACVDAVDYYAPSNWVPHVTLAQHDLNGESLSAAVGLLSRQPLHWTIAIDNLAFIDATGPEQRLTARFELRG